MQLYGGEMKFNRNMHYYNVKVQNMNVENVEAFVNLKYHIKHIYNIWP